jgi:hypothetical protein
VLAIAKIIKALPAKQRAEKLREKEEGELPVFKLAKIELRFWKK